VGRALLITNLGEKKVVASTQAPVRKAVRKEGAERVYEPPSSEDKEGGGNSARGGKVLQETPAIH